MSKQDQDSKQPAERTAGGKADEEAQGLRKIAELFPQMKKFVGDMVQGMPKPNVAGTQGMPAADKNTLAPEADAAPPAGDKPA